MLAYDFALVSKLLLAKRFYLFIGEDQLTVTSST